MSIPYDLEEDGVRAFIRGTGAKRVALQLPAGLRPMLRTIRETVEDAGAEPVFLGDPCYGACDPGDERARMAGCDALVHYGHSDMGLKTSVPVMYVEARMTIDPVDHVRKSLDLISFRRVGLISSVQHAWSLERVAAVLVENGMQPVISAPGPRTRHPGQVLGCEFFCARSIADRVDGFLYIGTGAFHPLGCLLAAGKSTVSINPVSGLFTDFSADDLLRRRAAAVSRASFCDSFGVVASTKPGQMRLGLAEKIAEELRNAGRDAHVISVDRVTPEELDDFGLEAFVCTACPRIALDDSERFRGPVLTPFECRVMLGSEDFGRYRMDEL
ncbi:MAG: diphthamide biosynthesis enzyme Dph2 [Candidatus Hadarchaeales archaeon]